MLQGAMRQGHMNKHLWEVSGVKKLKVTLGCVLLLTLFPAVGFGLGKSQVIANLASSLNIVVDGRNIDISGNTPVEYQGKNYVPLRTIGEALGCSVNWDGTTKTVSINTKEDNAALAGNDKVEVLSASVTPRMSPLSDNRYNGYYQGTVAVNLKQALSRNAVVTVDILNHKKNIVSSKTIVLNDKDLGTYEYSFSTSIFALPFTASSDGEAEEKMASAYSYRVKIK